MQQSHQKPLFAGLLAVFLKAIRQGLLSRIAIELSTVEIVTVLSPNSPID